QSRTVPMSVEHILDHGQDSDPGLRRLNVGKSPLVDVSLQVHVLALEAEPARKDPVEMGQGPLQRGEAVVVPVHIEADAEGPILWPGKRLGEGMYFGRRHGWMEGLRHSLL